MLLLQAIVLGLLQGLTEFLPVSSSGHLQGVPFLLGWDSGSLAFDVLVHLGTLLAVVVYLRADLLDLLRGVVGAASVAPDDRRTARRLVLLLALGSLPAAAAGLALADVFTAAFGSPLAVAGFLYLTAAVLWSAERLRRARVASGAAAAAAAASGGGLGGRDDGRGPADPGRGTADLKVRDALVIGAAQAFAIFPGVSRSGATIAAGMALGLSRTAAARFSFLLSIPVILGAGLVTARDLGTPEPGALPFGPLELVVGVTVAAVSGYWAIRTLLGLVQRRDLLGFARYVVVFATVLLGAVLLRG